MPGSRVYRSPEAPNELVVINEMADRTRAEAFAAWAGIKVGVIGVAEVYYAN
jgi:hypothetical protein